MANNAFPTTTQLKTDESPAQCVYLSIAPSCMDFTLKSPFLLYSTSSCLILYLQNSKTKSTTISRGADLLLVHGVIFPSNIR
ncbi:hypothetical protein FRX31_019243 [Thalictrum thalictroides]|uniref:Uncharacterized protein n=1 Tax=Thalictrum thalictroides TaxID=46969 RepID=A0A7J6W3T5_THATH|nr:hypothetical protein FRX31_019243 [Thalictrum thalictroides]